MSQPQNIFSLSYQGVRAQKPPNVIVKNFDPRSTFSKNVAIGDIWINFDPKLPLVSKLWILLGLSGDVANWVEIVASSDVIFLTGNNGGPISPVAGNINLITANSTVLVSGNAATGTLTLDFGTNTNLLLGASGSSITSGNFNVGLGINSLLDVNSGARNTALGAVSLVFLTTGNDNTAVGAGSLTTLVSGNSNTAVGSGSLGAITTSSQNTAVGKSSLTSLLTGQNNTAVGFSAGVNYTGAESSNIIIGNSGLTGENNTLRLGTDGVGAGQQNRAFIAGINGNTVANATNVTIDTVTGQLGVGGAAGNSNVVNSSASAVTPADLNLVKNRAGGPIVAGDEIGCLNFQGYDSLSTPITAGAICITNLTTPPSTIGPNRVAGVMQFYTHQDIGVVNPILRMTIDQTGILTLNKADNDNFTLSNVATFNCLGSSNISQNNLVATSGALAQLVKTRAGGSIVSGDNVGTINFIGFDSASTEIPAGSITVLSGGTIAPNRVAGTMVFRTHPDAPAALDTTRMQISNNGVVSIFTPDTATAALQVAGSISAGGDPGVGIAATTNLTNGTATAAGAGTVTFHANGAGNITQTGWLKFYVNGVASYVPYFQSI